MRPSTYLALSKVQVGGVPALISGHPCSSILWLLPSLCGLGVTLLPQTGVTCSRCPPTLPVSGSGRIPMGTMAPVSGEGGARSLLEVLLSYQGMGQRRMVAASWQNVFIQGEA